VEDQGNAEELSRAERLAARARDLAARAEDVSSRAAEAAASDEELAALERELADLDEEERKLDEEFAGLLDEGLLTDDTPPRDRSYGRFDWTERIAAFGERLNDVFSRGFLSHPFGSTDTIERAVDVDGPVPVSIDTFAGKVTVREGDAGTVGVVAERRGVTQAEIDAITVDLDHDASGVRVRCRADRPHGHRWVSLTVSVPRTSPLSIATRGGSIRVERVGGPVAAETRGGSIRVDGADGATSLDTMGGSITASDHRGPLTAHTKGGSIRLSGSLAGPVDADTMGGSIHVEGVDGSVRAQTVGGSVHVSGRFSGDCSLSTIGGSVSVGLAPGSNVRVEATGSSSVTDVPGLRASRGHIEGTVGDGSDGSLTLRTSGGSVSIHTA
jgi:hypothetical protein